MWLVGSKPIRSNVTILTTSFLCSFFWQMMSCAVVIMTSFIIPFPSILNNYFNPLSPNIHIQILQTDLHTFPLRISWENLIKHQGIFSFVIIFYILTTLSLDNVWTLLGENCCWSLLGGCQLWYTPDWKNIVAWKV